MDISKCQVYRRDGKFIGIIRANDDGTTTSFGPGSNLWSRFLEANALAATPLDLSDKPPDPPTDAEKRISTAKKYIKDNWSTLSPEVKALAILLQAD